MALSKSSSAAPTKMRLHTTAAPMERKDETRVKGFDLPPGAGRGTDDKGHVSLTVDGLEWQLRGAPPWVRVTARWWGDELSDKRTRPWAKLVDGPGASASMTFPVKAKPAGFSRYCRDARAVVLEVGSIHARPTRLAPDSKSASLQTSHLAPASPTRAHRPRILPLIPYQFSDGRTARHIASASVDVSRLEVHRPVTRHEVQLTTKAGGALGCVQRRVRPRLRHRRGVILRAQRAPQQDGRYPPLGAAAVDTHAGGWAEGARGEGCRVEEDVVRARPGKPRRRQAREVESTDRRHRQTPTREGERRNEPPETGRRTGQDARVGRGQGREEEGVGQREAARIREEPEHQETFIGAQETW